MYSVDHIQMEFQLPSVPGQREATGPALQTEAVACLSSGFPLHQPTTELVLRWLGQELCLEVLRLGGLCSVERGRQSSFPSSPSDLCGRDGSLSCSLDSCVPGGNAGWRRCTHKVRVSPNDFSGEG